MLKLRDSAYHGPTFLTSPLNRTEKSTRLQLTRSETPLSRMRRRERYAKYVYLALLLLCFLFVIFVVSLMLTQEHFCSSRRETSFSTTGAFHKRGKTLLTFIQMPRDAAETMILWMFARLDSASFNPE
jgi:hypothetical protein